jgi:hypothetical protein
MDTMKLVDDKITELNSLYKRMDNTKDKVYNQGRNLQGFDNQDIKNVKNVKLPYPRIFANAVIMELMTSKRQTVIEGDLTDRQAAKIEEFLDDMRDQADEVLGKRGQPSIFSWWCSHVCIRSLIGIRWITQVEGNEFKMYPLLLDMRYVPFEYGNDGFNWFCNITHRSPSQIKAEYPDAKVSGKADVEVRDFWDSEKNEIWIDGKQYTGQGHLNDQHQFGYPPVVIKSPATGFMLRDKGYIEHEAEDLLFLISNLYDVVNDQVSIEQSLALESILPPYMKPSDNPATIAKPPDSPPKMGETKGVKKGEEWQLVPRENTLSNAFMAARQDIARAMQLGGVNDIDIGNVDQQVSAVWITTQTSIRNKFTKPRLDCIAEAEEQLARMIIDQYTKACEGKLQQTDLGKRGRKRTYAVKDMGDPDKYSIEYRLMTQNRTQEVANWAIASTALSMGAPERLVVRDILMSDDPDGWIREKELEAARKADPAIGLFEMALRYVEEAEETEDPHEADAKRIQSKMLTERGVAVINERKQPAQMPENVRVPEVQQTKPNAQALMPLVGGGNQIVKPQAAPKEEVNVGS